jgi:hypothetical protein
MEVKSPDLGELELPVKKELSAGQCQWEPRRCHTRSNWHSRKAFLNLPEAADDAACTEYSYLT